MILVTLGTQKQSFTRLLNLIEKANISYGELAEITGIPKSALQRYAGSLSSAAVM